MMVAVSVIAIVGWFGIMYGVAIFLSTYISLPLSVLVGAFCSAVVSCTIIAILEKRPIIEVANEMATH